MEKLQYATNQLTAYQGDAGTRSWQDAEAVKSCGHLHRLGTVSRTEVRNEEQTRCHRRTDRIDAGWAG